MSTVYDLQGTALALMFEANAKLREQIKSAISKPESDPAELRDFCTLRFDVGQRTGKTTWVDANRKDDWIVIDYMGHDEGNENVHNRVQYIDALNKAKTARVVVITPAVYLLHAFDPRGTDMFKVLSDTYVEGRTILLLG
jgi:hypothetical protein